ncbi:MAG: hypothetical protein ACTHU0_24545 [Kofleriaceae bacterium]
MKVVASTLLVLGACSFPGNNTGDDAPPKDAVHDGDNGDAAPDAQSCFGVPGWMVCLTSLPMDELPLGATLDTGDAASPGPSCLPSIPQSWTDGGQPPACFVAARRITVAGTLSVTGDLPLVLVATDEIVVDGMIDAASHRGGSKGPNANPTGCTSSDGGSAGNRGGGAAGGSFGTQGAAGGTGAAGVVPGGMPPPASPEPHDKLRGGCRGGAGGAGDDRPAGGGQGGGALYLVAGNAIEINALVNASGAGGDGGDASRGGAGGGGAGGMIVAYAPTLTVGTSGLMVANGGGGGGGAGSGGANGTAGADPDPSDALTPAAPAPPSPWSPRTAATRPETPAAAVAVAASASSCCSAARRSDRDRDPAADRGRRVAAGSAAWIPPAARDRWRCVDRGSRPAARGLVARRRRARRRVRTRTNAGHLARFLDEDFAAPRRS